MSSHQASDMCARTSRDTGLSQPRSPVLIALNKIDATRPSTVAVEIPGCVRRSSHIHVGPARNMPLAERQREVLTHPAVERKPPSARKTLQAALHPPHAASELVPRRLPAPVYRPRIDDVHLMPIGHHAVGILHSHLISPRRPRRRVRKQNHHLHLIQ